MVKSLLKISALSLLSFVVSAADNVTVSTAKGDVDVSKNPAKVAVLDLGILENLHALEVNVGAVNDSLYLPELTEAFKDATRVGTLHEPNVEALIQYQPDLIIVAARSSKHLDALSKIAPTIDMSVRGDNFVAKSKKNVRELAKIFDKTDAADTLIARIDDKLAAVNAATKDKGNALFVLTTGPKISAYGKESRFGWIHNDFGIAEAVENVKKATHGEPISFEFIKKANPEWLLVFDRAAAIGKDGDAAKAVLDNALVAETPAWKKQQVVYFDPAIYLAIGGIKGIENAIDTVTEAFNKAQ